MIRLPVDKNKIVDTCKQNDVSFLGIFGSYSRGEQKPDSDIDFLVRFSKKKSLLDLVRTERNFSEIMGMNVDLLTENSISPYLKDRIMSDLKVVYP